MTFRSFPNISALLVSSFTLAACGASDPTGEDGTGTLVVTTWGEEYIQEEIPGDEFIDGWTITYEKFLVNIGNVAVADSSGETAASHDGAILFDHKVAGVKPLATFEDVPAKAWDDVSYEIGPVTEASELGPDVAEADRTMMSDAGYSVYVVGSATKDDVTKSFEWGFDLGTKYELCHSEQDGRDQLGVVVTKNAEVTVQLTIHGDHPFYDRLQSAGSAVETSLRFDALAEADADADDVVTLEELDAVPLDVTRYNLSGFDASTQGEFLTALVRTIGHFRGEGECEISRL